jgi:hypothetical protein
MTAEATRSTSTFDDPAPMGFDVAVVFMPPVTPGGDPSFKFFGLTAPNNATVQTPQADFLLTLSTNAPGTVTFDAVPITWLKPGDQTQPIAQPDYITNLAATDSQVTFTDLNPADPSAAILVSFVVNVKYLPLSNDDSFLLFSSAGLAFFEDTFTSHDPTIINVDPTGSGNLKSADA